MQKLLTKNKFAELAGVNPSTVTRLCKTLLLPAVVGKHVDAAHPAAVDYIRKQEEKASAPRPENTPPGIDPLYPAACDVMAQEGRCSRTMLQRKLKIGWSRADKVFLAMVANGVVEDEGKPKIIPSQQATSPEPKPKKPHGGAAVRESKKRQTETEEQSLIEIPEDIKAFSDWTIRQILEKFGTDVRFVDFLKATKEIEHINEKRLKNAQTEGVLVSRELMRIGVIESFETAHVKLLTDGAKTIARRATAMHDAKRDLGDIEKFVKDQISSFIRPALAKVERAMKNA